MKTQIVSAAALAMLGVVGAAPAMAQQAPIVRGTAADLRVLRPIAGEIAVSYTHLTLPTKRIV